MNLSIRLAVLSASVGPAVVLTIAAGMPQAARGRQPSVDADVRPAAAKYCAGCHAGPSAPAGIDLSQRLDGATIGRDRAAWNRIARAVEIGNMPPSGAAQPSPDQRARFVGAVRSVLGKAQGPSGPGRVTVRRLNRDEYNNTVRDLFGLDIRPADTWPSDDVGYGFDNIGDVLSLSPLLMEKIADAAERVAEAAVTSPRSRLVSGDRRARLAGASGAAVLRSLVAETARRAWRRPVMDREIDRLLSVGGQGSALDRSLRLAVQAILASPSFLYRIERGPAAKQTVRSLDSHELASRLSYFLWSSMPDDALSRLADQGKLTKTAVLTAQARRMLADPKARALTDGFALQWLELRRLATVQPDPGRFRGFDSGLRSAMQKESELFFSRIVREDRSVLEFLDAPYTYLNERLARHYGIGGVTGGGFRLVRLSDSRRGGLLTQASVLTATSNPTRTSPVKRGKWVLDEILGEPPPPPPANVPPLQDDKGGPVTGTLRQRTEQHRKDPMCASCHLRMDPLGFGLENYDAVGAWRETDGGAAIDASGVLPDGSRFAGPAQLKAVLRKKKDQFTRCLSEKLLIYALGRGMRPGDGPTIDRIARSAAQGGYRFSAIIFAIVGADSFRKQGVEAGPER